VLPPSPELKLKVALVLLVGDPGLEVMVVSGGVVSTMGSALTIKVVGFPLPSTSVIANTICPELLM
jgi:hypothetical protein